jgi:hypothetical protein
MQNAVTQARAQVSFSLRNQGWHVSSPSFNLALSEGRTLSERAHCLDAGERALRPERAAKKESSTAQLKEALAAMSSIDRVEESKGVATMDHQHQHKDGAAGFAPELPEGYRLQVADIDAATEKRIRRKLDRVLILLVSLMYLVAFLDRGNIGNAQTAGMGKALGLSDAQYQVSLLGLEFSCAWSRRNKSERELTKRQNGAVALDNFLHSV